MQQRNTDPRKRPALILLTILCSLAGPLSAGTLYKWVDEDGRVRYADRLPPQQIKQRHQQLNSQGVVLSTREAAKPAEELAIEAEAKRKQEIEQKEADRLQAIQDQQDRVLLLTFASEEELEHARDNRIEVIDSVIRLIENSIGTTQSKLDSLTQSAEAAYVSKGNAIPGGLQQKIEFFTRKIESRNLQLQAKKAEREKISEKYELDLERFRNLKSASN
jgi:hypothetical protein